MGDINFGERALVQELRDGNVVCEIYEKEVEQNDTSRLFHDICLYRTYEKDGAIHKEPYIQQRDFDRLHILISKAHIFIRRRIYQLNKARYESDEEDYQD